LRTVTLASGAAAELIQLGSLEHPVGSYELPIGHPDELQLNEDGALHVQLNVSNLQLQETENIKLKEIDRSWKMDFIRLELYGRTAERPTMTR
ncbi:MAG: hypothetical protein ABGZ24_13655, partial [Fuerstiella sp.]